MISNEWMLFSSSSWRLMVDWRLPTSEWTMAFVAARVARASERFSALATAIWAVLSVEARPPSRRRRRVRSREVFAEACSRAFGVQPVGYLRDVERK